MRPGCMFFVLLIVAVLVALFASLFLGLLWIWAIVAGLMLVTFVATGLSLGKGPLGILIDPLTNTMSFSRLQILLWTWVVFSALSTLWMARVADAYTNPDAYTCPAPAEGQAATCADPLGIQLPPQLLALMGISLTSAVGAPLLKTAKAQRTVGQNVTNQERARTRSQPETAATFGTVLQQRQTSPAGTGASLENTRAIGALVKREKPAQATISDVFTGDEVATFGYVDIAKVQNLFFTVIAVVAYAVALAGAMVTTDVAAFLAFPDPTAGLVALIGISSGGYLVDKAVTHSVPEAETPVV